MIPKQATPISVYHRQSSLPINKSRNKNSRPPPSHPIQITDYRLHMRLELSASLLAGKFARFPLHTPGSLSIEFLFPGNQEIRPQCGHIFGLITRQYKII